MLFPSTVEAVSIKRFLKITIPVVLIVLVVGFIYANSTAIKTKAANAAIDTLNIKEQVNDAAYAHASDIASATGLSEDEVDSAIDNIDIDDWEATTLPSSVTTTGTYDTTYEGKAVTVTTYDDPGYVTVGVSGTDVTFAVPESAETYVTQLSALI